MAEEESKDQYESDIPGEKDFLTRPKLAASEQMRS